MKNAKRFRQAYLDVCFNHTGLIQRRRNPILRMFNFDGYLTKY